MKLFCSQTSCTLLSSKKMCILDTLTLLYSTHIWASSIGQPSLESCECEKIRDIKTWHAKLAYLFKIRYKEKVTMLPLAWIMVLLHLQVCQIPQFYYEMNIVSIILMHYTRIVHIILKIERVWPCLQRETTPSYGVGMNVEQITLIILATRKWIWSG